MALAAVVLAAGGGTRMHSRKPKVLHEIAGAPMIWHVLKTVAELAPDRTVVVTGNGTQDVEASVSAFSPEIEIARQERQLGTAHAVAATGRKFSNFDGLLVVLYGDTPNVSSATIRSLIASCNSGADVAVLGFRPQDTAGYGRLICNPDGDLQRIVEAADASEPERRVGFCNSGVICAGSGTLFALLEQVENNNSAGEYYLTDIVSIATAAGLRCHAIEGGEDEMLGVNSRAELARAECMFQARARIAAIAGGVAMVAPETVFFGFGSHVGADTIIEPYVVIGSHVTIGPGATVRSFSYLRNCRIGANASVGPYARIRTGTELADGASVGNFVEVKASSIGAGSKVPHLSYIGDTEIGRGTNIGAGTITCNYDGKFKNKTKIGEQVFIGSNSTIVAPLEIADEAMTAAGSVITQDVPGGALAVARQRQENKAGVATRYRERLRRTKEEG